MRTEKVSFPGGFADYELVGRLDLPDDHEPAAYALFAHCFTCTKNLLAISNINRAMTDEDIGVFRFDFTGLGESEGDFAETNFSSNVADLVAAASFLADHYAAPQILMGHSLGGTAVIAAADQIPSAAAVATIAAPADTAHMANLLRRRSPELEEVGEAEVMLAGRPFRIKKQLLEDLERNQMQQKIASLGRALLIMHSPADRLVSIENAAEIFQAAQHPKSFLSLDRADHLLLEDEDSCYAGAMTATWARRYL